MTHRLRLVLFQHRDRLIAQLLDLGAGAAGSHGLLRALDRTGRALAITRSRGPTRKLAGSCSAGHRCGGQPATGGAAASVPRHRVVGAQPARQACASPRSAGARLNQGRADYGCTRCIWVQCTLMHPVHLRCGHFSYGVHRCTLDPSDLPDPAGPLPSHALAEHILLAAAPARFHRVAVLNIAAFSRDLFEVAAPVIDGHRQPDAAGFIMCRSTFADMGERLLKCTQGESAGGRQADRLAVTAAAQCHGRQPGVSTEFDRHRSKSLALAGRRRRAFVQLTFMATSASPSARSPIITTSMSHSSVVSP